MMVQDTEEHTGRRGLFTVTGEEKSQSGPEKNNQEFEEILAAITAYKTGDFPSVPDTFTPLLKRLKRDAETLLANQQEKEDIFKNLESLKEEQTALKKEHETFLSDLISAHTEFDRALEIFQYHTIPMVLLGSKQEVMDANEIFCSIFSVERSEITKKHPLLSQYVSGETPFIAPDGISYSVVSVQPPIVPFDHDAISLHLLAPYTCDEESTLSKRISYQILEDALTDLLLPVAIVDEYHTVQFCNNSFLRHLGREKQDVTYRDIASCGFSVDITQKIDEVMSSESPLDFQITITHRDNAGLQVWTALTPLIDGERKYTLITVLPDEEESEISSIETELQSSKSSNTFIKTLIDLNSSPIVLFDKSSKIILANEGLSELIGVSAEQLQGQNLTDIGIKIPDISSSVEEIEVLSDKVCIESPYGIQCYSGLLITNNSLDSSQYILVLQPPVESGAARVCKDESEKIENVQILPAETYEKKKSSPIKNLDIGSVPVPVILICDNEVREINEAFRLWSGISDDKISEYSAILLSHSVQSKEGSSQIFSSVFPAGLKSYQILSHVNPADPSRRESWIFDQTEAYETITNLRTQVDNISKELTTVRENQSEKQTSLTFSDTLSDQIDIVEFELSGGRYAMDIGMVREVVEMLPITPLPRTPAYIIGIINLRGDVTHVVDLGILLGERVKKDRTGQKIIIVPPDAAHGEHLGIIVDNVRSVTEIGVRQVTPLGEEINTRIQTRIKGIIKVTHDDLIEKRDGDEKEDNLVIWLDMKEILNRLAGSTNI